MLVSYADAGTVMSDDAPGVVTGIVNGEPMRDGMNRITHVPVYTERDNSREATTIWVAIENMLGETDAEA